MAAPDNILVIGECGNGKSTLIDALRDKAASRSPQTGKDPSGVTKQISVYPCRHPDGTTFNLIDTPGIGDHSVNPVTLIAMLEKFLSGVRARGGVRGVLVTTPVPDARVRFGSQVVRAIVDKGFLVSNGEDKYANVVLVGTKLDRADEDDMRHFLYGARGVKSVRDAFFESHSDPRRGRTVMVHKDDYRPLLAELQELPSRAVQFRPPERDILVSEFARRAGIGQQEVASLGEQARKNERAIYEACRRLREAARRQREEQARRAAQEAEIERQRREEQERARREAEEARRRFEAQQAEERRQHEEERRRTERRQEEERQRLAREREAERRRQEEAARRRKEELERANAPQGHQTDGGGAHWCGVANTRWGRIPGKVKGGTCWYSYGGKEHTTGSFTLVRDQGRGRSALGGPQGHQTDGQGNLWCAVARTRWGTIPGKAKGGTCWFPYGGKEHTTSDFDYIG